jgi:DNA-directed RNA polymerase specialized sigma subunit
LTLQKYLSRAYRINNRINISINNVEALTKFLAYVLEKYQPMAQKYVLREKAKDDLGKLKHKICEDIDLLVDVKRETYDAIKCVHNIDQQIVLERRCLCFQRWDEIADALGYSFKRVMKIHDAAISTIARELAS